jgi:hypothetical protein
MIMETAASRARYGRFVPANSAELVMMRRYDRFAGRLRPRRTQ